MVKETRSAAEIRQAEAKERIRENELVDGLARCPVCGGRAKAVMFGAREEGVWVGCERSVACMRNIEYHRGGWSLEEVCAEWNRRNRGVSVLIRRMKMWCERKYGKRARYDRARERAEKLRREKGREERKRVFFGEGEGDEGAKMWWLAEFFGKIIKKRKGR